MSDKSVAERLFIRPGYRVLLVNAPAGNANLLGELPPGTEICTQTNDRVDLVLIFVESRQELEEQLGGVRQRLKPGGLLWVSYPKGTSKKKADINRDSINAYAKNLGFQGVAMISIDDTWSAMRFKVLLQA